MKNILSRLKKADMILCAVILAAAAVIALSGASRAGSGSIAVVTKDGETLYRYDITGLSEPVTVTVEGKCTNIITFADGWAAFTESNCPHMDCVHTGKLEKSGERAVCLENRVILTIEGEAEVDGVTE